MKLNNTYKIGNQTSYKITLCKNVAYHVSQKEMTVNKNKKITNLFD